MQRGLRVNGNSEQLWLEYFRLELLYLQRVHARRMVLGLHRTATKKTSKESTGGDDDDGDDDGEEEEEEDAKAAFLSGAVPQLVFQKAFKGARRW